MFKSNYIFVWSLLIGVQGYQVNPPFLSQLDLDLRVTLTCAKWAHTQARVKNTSYCNVLMSSLWHCCIATNYAWALLMLVDRTQQLNSWEFWGMWHLDWQQRTSKLFTASVPTLCQAVALIKGGPIYAHFYAICGISLLKHELLCNRHNMKKINKVHHSSLWSQFCRGYHGNAFRVGTLLLLLMLGPLNHSWGFWMQLNVFVSRSKSCRQS